MKKVVVIFLLLLLIGLTGAQGCTPPSFLNRFSGNGVELIKLRGLSVEFVRGKPPLRDLKDEKLPVLRANKNFEIGLKVSNYLLKDISGDISVSNLYSNNKLSDKDSFDVEPAVEQDGKLYPSEAFVSFGHIYTSVGKDGIEDSLITKLNVRFNALINTDLCFRKDESISGISCNNDETLTENMLRGDAGFLPISIERIVKEVFVDSSGDEAEFVLTFKFKNFGDGSIEDDKIKDFNVNILGLEENCGNNELIFRDGKAEIECTGFVGFGEEAFVKVPAEFRFSYLYEVVRTINYKVM